MLSVAIKSASSSELDVDAFVKKTVARGFFLLPAHDAERAHPADDSIDAIALTDKKFGVFH